MLKQINFKGDLSEAVPSNAPVHKWGQLEVRLT